MALKSKLFKDDAKLNACLVDNAAHVTAGSVGDHVGKIQLALHDLDGAQISESERRAKSYGQSTAAAVLSYKRKRNIINFSYQSQADNIVGKMTIAALDREVLELEDEAFLIAALSVLAVVVDYDPYHPNQPSSLRTLRDVAAVVAPRRGRAA